MSLHSFTKIFLGPEGPEGYLLSASPYVGGYAARADAWWFNNSMGLRWGTGTQACFYCWGCMGRDHQRALQTGKACSWTADGEGIWVGGRERCILLRQPCVTPSCGMDGNAFQSVSLCVLPGWLVSFGIPQGCPAVHRAEPWYVLLHWSLVSCFWEAPTSFRLGDEG